MKKNAIWLVILLCIGCVPVSEDTVNHNPRHRIDSNSMPRCRNETMVAVYDEQGTYTVPGCVEYVMPNMTAEYVYVTQENTDETEDKEVDAADIPGTFPEVESNKYQKDQVIMQNLNTRVLAYCRGSEAEINYCVERLENSCYVRLGDIPKVTAKYDSLRRGVYPGRRWHEGDVVPRW